MRDHMRVELVPPRCGWCSDSAARCRIDPPHRSAPSTLHINIAALAVAGITASMSRKADCYDNALIESFFHTLKTELVHHRQYQTRAEAQRDIFAFIQGIYNRTRLPSATGYIPPIEGELKAT